MMSLPEARSHATPAAERIPRRRDFHRATCAAVTHARSRWTQTTAAGLALLSLMPLAGRAAAPERTDPLPAALAADTSSTDPAV